MATPPVFEAEYEVASWTISTTPRTVSPTTNVGDKLVVAAVTADQLTQLTSPPTGNSLTYTLAQSIEAASSCQVYGWTAPDNTGGAGWTLSVSETGSGAPPWGFTVPRFSGSDGFGASAKTGPTSGAPTMDITTTADNSALVVMVGDWAAVDGASRTWRTVNGITPSSGNGLELVYTRDSINYTVYIAYYSDAGAAGTKTVGLSAPGGQTYSIIAIEVKGTAAAAVAPAIQSARPGKTWERRFRHRQILYPGAAAADIRADTGLATIGLSADSTAKKVAVVSASSSLGLTVVSTAAKVAKTTSVGTVGLSSNAVHVDVRAVTAFATIGLGSTVTAKKVTPTASAGTVGLAGTVTAKKVTPATLRSTVGLTGFVTARKVAPATGRGVIGLQASFAHVEIHPITALTTLGATAYLTGKKRSTPLAAGIVGLTGNALPKKISKSTGAGILAISGSATVKKRQAVTGRSVIGLFSWWERIPPIVYGRARVAAGITAAGAVSEGRTIGAKASTGTGVAGAVGTGTGAQGHPGTSDSASGEVGGDV